MSNLAVYTVIFGNYDTLRIVPLVDASVDYICFADHAFDAPYPWQVRVVDPLPHTDVVKASRYYLGQATQVLPDYEYTIAHGGDATLTILPVTLLNFVRDADIAAFRHPHRNNVYEEPAAITALGKDTNVERMERQMAFYRWQGFSGTPFHATGLLVRKNTPALRVFEHVWWQQILAGSHRNQLSFDYAAWVTGTTVADIPGDVFNNPYLKICHSL